MKVLVTGANGLVGQAVCATLKQAGLTLVRAVRRASASSDLVMGDLSGQTDWAALLPVGLDAVVHLAAQVPGGGREDDATVQAYQRTNVEGTLHLARGCAEKGVKRFVFISTAKVFGEGQDEPYSSHDPAQPEDTYAASKWAAEQGLHALASETGLELVILRPPLVYGPGVKGNFLRLMRMVERGIPLPFGAVHNRRSMIGVGNLADAIRLSVIHPAAAGRTYAVSDGEDLSTPALIREIALAMQRKSFLLPIPVQWMTWVGKMLGKADVVERLTGSLCLDISAIRTDLRWTPPQSVRQGLESTVSSYRMNRSQSS